MQQRQDQERSRNPQSTSGIHSGAFLRSRRHLWGVDQQDVVTYLPGWTQPNFSRLESNGIAPAFSDLLTIYTAMHKAGVQWTLADRRMYLDLAQQKLSSKKTHRERLSPSDWFELQLQLAQEDQLPTSFEPSEQHQHVVSVKPVLADTRRLVGRENWFSSLIKLTQDRETVKKLFVLQGPVGIGKSMEMTRLTRHFLHISSFKVIWNAFPPVERATGPRATLETFLRMVSGEVDPVAARTVSLSLEQQITSLISILARSEAPILIFADNAECVLEAGGKLAACWESFLQQFLRSQHNATLFLASQEWPGWPGRDRQFVIETIVPPLETNDGVLLLQQLGLEHVPLPVLRDVNARTGGIPLCLEWLAALAQDPLLCDDWQIYDVEDGGGQEKRSSPEEENEVTRRVQLLLAEPAILGGHIATKLHPLLQRIMEKRLSLEARAMMQQLAVAPLPLGASAMKELCEHPNVIKELRDASLLVSFRQRVQLLPMVTSVVLQQLTLEQQHQLEERLSGALATWLDEGIASEREKGNVLSERIALLIHHHKLLDAAELLIQHSWLSFYAGHTFRLAQLAQSEMEHFDWHAFPENECGGFILHYHLAPFLEKRVLAQERAEAYRHIECQAAAGYVSLQPQTEVHVLHHLMQYHINQARFTEAQALFDACKERMDVHLTNNPELHASLLAKKAWLLGTWSDYVQEQGDAVEASQLREQTIALYQQCATLLATSEERGPTLRMSTIKKRLARIFNDLGYYLHRSGQYEQALSYLERSIALKEQGFVEPGSLAASYGEKSQVLASLGHYREALRFDQLAIEDIQAQVKTGHDLSQQDQWTYQVNRGRLYLKVGRVDEAEQLLRDALEHISERRPTYRAWAEASLKEIEAWRLHSPQLQLDWRWSARFRAIVSYNMFRWLAHAGPFTHAEQHEWQLMVARNDESAQKRKDALVNASRERELAAARQGQREPDLRYPAIPLGDVKHRIAALLQLDQEVQTQEPNVIVCRLYHGAIEQELESLYMMEASAEGNGNAFWRYNRLIHAEPTGAEMDIAFDQVRSLIAKGKQREDTRILSEDLDRTLRSLGMPGFPGSTLPDSRVEDVEKRSSFNLQSEPRMVSPETLQHFFDAALQEYGFVGWQTTIEATAKAPRIEQSIRQLVLPDEAVSLTRARHLLSHELETHVFRSNAGEHSSLALLAIGTKNFLQTEEGLALYYDRETDQLQGEASAKTIPTSVWIGTLATSLASGVTTPPLTFWALFTLLEQILVVQRLLQSFDANLATTQRKAHDLALTRCLRTFRGVPDLTHPGHCYTKDALYLRGLLSVGDALAKDETVLERLMVGMVGLEQLADLEELGIVTPPNRPQWLAHRPDLEAYILSFAESPL
jgi:tetratricopeptide (TPR) repeat protein